MDPCEPVLGLDSNSIVDAPLILQKPCSIIHDLQLVAPENPLRFPPSQARQISEHKHHDAPLARNELSSKG